MAVGYNRETADVESGGGAEADVTGKRKKNGVRGNWSWRFSMPASQYQSFEGEKRSMKLCDYVKDVQDMNTNK